MGSKLGWILAAILVVLILCFAAWRLWPELRARYMPTLPTRATAAPGMLALLRPAEPISLALGRQLSAEGDAGEDYHRALEAYTANRPLIVEICGHARKVAAGEYRLIGDDVRLLKEVADPIAAGAMREKMTYYFRLTRKEIEIPYFADEAGRFQDLCDVPRMLAVHYESTGEGGYAEAEKVLLDMLVLGYHLMSERARLEIVLRGVGLQEDACGRLVRLYEKWQKPERAEQVRRYSSGLWDIGSVYSDLFNLTWSFQRRGGAYGPHPGDIFNLVENHQDRSVRVEAILALGVVKLTAATSRGDQQHIRKLIQQKLSSEDAIERAAARCADALDAAGLKRLARSE